MVTVEVELKTPRGQNIQKMIDAIEQESEPTVGDLMLAGFRQRKRMLDRTASGQDFRGTAFAAYKTAPYYYYPNKDKSDKARKAAVTRIVRRRGLVKGNPEGARRTGKGKGIRFASYAAFKLQVTGSSTVNLRGPKDPHMLNRIELRSGGFVAGSRDNPPDSSAHASELVIGIYGEAGGRAVGNERQGRAFMGVTESDKSAMLRDIVNRVMQRIRRAMR